MSEDPEPPSQLRLRGAGRVVRTIRTGSSGATVTILRRTDGMYVAVKTARSPRVSAVRQAERRAAIVRFLGPRLPRVLFAGSLGARDTLVTECPSPRTLADAAMTEATTASAVVAWEEVVSTLCDVWISSAREGFDERRATRNHQHRSQRAAGELVAACRALGITAPTSRRVIVSGTDLGTIGTALDSVRRLPLPRITVACHGDPQPRNVLLDADHGWHLIDWEWSGLVHDWRMMLSHVIGWWYIDALSAESVVVTDLQAAHSTLTVSYEPPFVADLAPWTTPAVTAFSRMSSPDRDELDVAGLTLHLAMLLLREFPRTVAAGRTGPALVLLCEAMRLAESVSSDTTHPLVAPLLVSSRLREVPHGHPRAGAASLR